MRILRRLAMISRWPHRLEIATKAAVTTTRATTPTYRCRSGAPPTSRSLWRFEPWVLGRPAGRPGVGPLFGNRPSCGGGGRDWIENGASFGFRHDRILI
jgi:hypothetical protein